MSYYHRSDPLEDMASTVGCLAIAVPIVGAYLFLKEIGKNQAYALDAKYEARAPGVTLGKREAVSYAEQRPQQINPDLSLATPATHSCTRAGAAGVFNGCSSVGGLGRRAPTVSRFWAQPQFGADKRPIPRASVPDVGVAVACAGRNAARLGGDRKKSKHGNCAARGMI
jgi:hypothetical protein